MLSYILSPKNLQVGDKIQAGTSAEISLGNALPVGSVPTGTIVHNVELKPGRGGQLMRAAGTFAKIIKKTDRFVVIRLHSGKSYSISPQAMATIGIVSGDSNEPTKLKKRKAGQSR